MHYIIGIDEVGRGSLAGPVTVAAVCVSRKLRIAENKSLGQLRDSKKLTARRREIFNAYFLRHPKVSYALAHVSPRVIDRINISNAANLAATRAVARLMRHIEGGNLYSLIRANKRIKPARARKIKIFLDGGLYLGSSMSRVASPILTVIRGDEKINAIKIASIIAKVRRDRLMSRLAKKYPQYGLEIHKGYGTRAHLAAIKKFGQSAIHRLTFVHRQR